MPRKQPSERQQACAHVLELAESFVDLWDDNNADGGDAEDKRGAAEAGKSIKLAGRIIRNATFMEDALRDALGAIDAMQTQIDQMRGMFDDEDGTIADAYDAGEQAAAKAARALKRTGARA